MYYHGYIDLRKGVACFFDRNCIQKKMNAPVNCWPFVCKHYGFGKSGAEGEVEDTSDSEGVVTSEKKLLIGLVVVCITFLLRPLPCMVMG